MAKLVVQLALTVLVALICVSKQDWTQDVWNRYINQIINFSSSLYRYRHKLIDVFAPIYCNAQGQSFTNGGCPAIESTVFQFADTPIEANWAYDKRLVRINYFLIIML